MGMLPDLRRDGGNIQNRIQVSHITAITASVGAMLRDNSGESSVADSRNA